MMNRFPLALLAAAAFAAGASAQSTLIIPSDVDAVTDGAGSSAYPWDRDSATAASNDIRVQYTYDTTNFPGIAGPILISQIRFRANATASSWTGGDYSNCEIRIGEAATDYATASTTFAANWPGGMDPAPNFSGAVTVTPGTGNGTGIPAPWYITVPLSPPVLYDPTSGNDLLIDVRHDGTWTGTASTGSVALDTARNACSRMYNISDWQSPTGSLQQSVGMVCELTYTPPNGTFPSFTVDKTDIGPGETVTFTDTTFSSSGVVAWNWDFDNDGNVDSNLQNPAVPYPACGTFDVKLEVLDNAGATPSIVRTGLINVGAPAADFSFVVIGTQAPFTVQLTDLSTGAPTSWSWDFDNDGTVDSMAQNPSFQIAARGVQTCSLTAGNACGTNQVTMDIDTRLLLCTQFTGGASWNSGSAFQYDLNVTNPAGVTIGALGVNASSLGATVGLDVYITPTTYVGKDQDRNAWAWVASGSNPSGAGPNTETIVDISDFSLAPGSWGIAVVYTVSAGSMSYSSGSNTVSNADLTLSGGQLNFPAFGSTNIFQPRYWNGCIYYAIGQDAGSFNVFGDGCPGSNGETMSIGLVGGVPTLNSMLTIETTGGVASNPIAGINFGFSAIQGGLDLGAIQMPGCTQWVNPDLAFTTPLDAAGTGSFSFMIPNDVNLLGGHFYVQPVAADLTVNSTGATVGDAGDGTIGM